MPHFHVKWIQVRVSAKVCSLANIRGGLQNKPRIPQSLDHSLSCIKSDRFNQSMKFNSEPQTWCCWLSTDGTEFRSTQQKGSIKKHVLWSRVWKMMSCHESCQICRLSAFNPWDIQKKIPRRNRWLRHFWNLTMLCTPIYNTGMGIFSVVLFFNFTHHFILRLTKAERQSGILNGV